MVASVNGDEFRRDHTATGVSGLMTSVIGSSIPAKSIKIVTAFGRLQLLSSGRA